MSIIKAKSSSDALAGLPDDRLVDMVRAGHQRAFEVIVHRYSKDLARYCARLGLADSRAEDVLQSSFMRAWSALARGTEVRELRPWLYRIVHNTALNAIRASANTLAPLCDVDGVDALVAPDGDVELRIAVRAALAEVAALPPMQRDALLMSAVDGRSREEVASALGVSDGAVRGLLYRARATLRAAAAALAPPPLLRWAYGQVSRHASSAGAAAEASARGAGVEVGANLIKGVAIAAIAFGGGAAAVTLHDQHKRTARSLPAVHFDEAGRTATAQLTDAHSASATTAGLPARAPASAPSSGYAPSLAAREGQGASRPAGTHAAVPTAPGPGSGSAPAVSTGTATTDARVASGTSAPAGSSEAVGREAPEVKPEAGSTGQKEAEAKTEEKASSGKGEEKKASQGESDDPEGSGEKESNDPEGSGEKGSGGSGDHEGEENGEKDKSDDGEGGDSSHGESDDGETTVGEGKGAREGTRESDS